jgi:hypothetical protein
MFYSLDLRYSVSYSYKTTVKITVLHILKFMCLRSEGRTEAEHKDRE